MLILRKLILLLIALIAYNNSNAQQGPAHSEKEYARNPLWIAMIKDTATNFFEAEKAFKIYFRHHTKPEGEHDVIGEHANTKKRLTKRERREMQAEDHMRMDVKRYEHWRDQVRPYVQADGSILTPSQRLKLWQEDKKK